MVTCKFCGKEFENRYSLSAHLGHCVLNPNRKIRTHSELSKSSKKSAETMRKKHPEWYEKKMYTFKCNKCGKTYTLELTDNEYKRGKFRKTCSASCANARKHSEETRNKIGNSLKNSESHKSSIHYKIYYCKECGKPFTMKDERNTRSRQYCSKECREAWLVKNFYFNKKRGNGKAGWYRGIHCDSSWELAYVIYCKDHNIPIERNTEFFEYIHEGEKYRYYPDFITPEGIIEIKGFQNEKWYSKLKQINNIKVIYKKEMIPYLKYVINTYGKNFIELYEK